MTRLMKGVLLSTHSLICGAFSLSWAKQDDPNFALFAFLGLMLSGATALGAIYNLIYAIVQSWTATEE